MRCFECGEDAVFSHHVVPRSLGGIKTVPLCSKHHGLVHCRTFLDVGMLTSQALQKKKANGEYLGGPLPFGYRLKADGKHLEVDPDAEVVTKKSKKGSKGTSVYKEFTAAWREQCPKVENAKGEMKLPQGWMKLQADAWNAHKAEQAEKK